MTTSRRKVSRANQAGGARKYLTLEELQHNHRAGSYPPKIGKDPMERGEPTYTKQAMAQRGYATGTVYRSDKTIGPSYVTPWKGATLYNYVSEDKNDINKGTGASGVRMSKNGRTAMLSEQAFNDFARYRRVNDEFCLLIQSVAMAGMKKREEVKYLDYFDQQVTTGSRYLFDVTSVVKQLTNTYDNNGNLRVVSTNQPKNYVVGNQLFPLRLDAHVIFGNLGAESGKLAVRLIIFQWSGTQFTSAPTYDDILEYPNDLLAFLSPIKHSNKEYIRVLWDVNSDLYRYKIDGAGSSRISKAQKPAVDKLSKVTFEERIPDQSGQLASPRKNAIFVMMISNSASGFYFKYYLRAPYTDC